MIHDADGAGDGPRFACREALRVLKVWSQSVTGLARRFAAGERTVSSTQTMRSSRVALAAANPLSCNFISRPNPFA